MPFLKIFAEYLLTLLVFFAVDMLWLGVFAKNIYNTYLGNFLSGQVNWAAAIVFYLLFVVGILVFVVYPSVEKNSLLSAVFLGALFGLCTYAAYDLTNYATLKNWPLPIVFIDLAWGSFVSMATSVAGFFIVRFFH